MPLLQWSHSTAQYLPFLRLIPHCSSVILFQPKNSTMQQKSWLTQSELGKMSNAMCCKLVYPIRSNRHYFCVCGWTVLHVISPNAMHQVINSVAFNRSVESLDILPESIKIACFSSIHLCWYFSPQEYASISLRIVSICCVHFSMSIHLSVNGMELQPKIPATNYRRSTRNIVKCNGYTAGA